jgi:hypothetical protein
VILSFGQPPFRLESKGLAMTGIGRAVKLPAVRFGQDDRLKSSAV